MNNQDWKNANPEQLNFWNQVKGKIAWNTITPLYYCGPIAGSEFLTYAATKLYVALELVGFETVIGSHNSAPLLSLYNEANVQYLTLTNFDWEYDATPAIMFVGRPVEARNFYFGRFFNLWYDQLKFNGYRLDIV